jgi:hypothetical protein
MTQPTRQPPGLTFFEPKSQPMQPQRPRPPGNKTTRCAIPTTGEMCCEPITSYSMVRPGPTGSVRHGSERSRRPITAPGNCYSPALSAANQPTVHSPDRRPCLHWRRVQQWYCGPQVAIPRPSQTIHTHPHLYSIFGDYRTSSPASNRETTRRFSVNQSSTSPRQINSTEILTGA